MHMKLITKNKKNLRRLVKNIIKGKNLEKLERKGETKKFFLLELDDKTQSVSK